MSITEPGIFDIFLSHARPDAETVEGIGIRLEEEAEFSVWLDKWVLIPGESWQQEMARGLNEAKACAVCIGGQTPRGWFREVIEKALNRQVREGDFRVIPVILPGGDSEYVEDFLELRSWIDFSNGVDDSEAFYRLICGVRGVQPGRFRTSNTGDDGTLSLVRDKLVKLKHLRQMDLVDDDIALDTQRRLMDMLIDE